MISARKNEPQWMTEWRLETYRHFVSMHEPEMANVTYEKPTFRQFHTIPHLAKKTKN
jgi:Fe-S cluster assembly protein SufB